VKRERSAFRDGRREAEGRGNYLFVEDQVIGVSVMLLERELRRVVVVNLGNRVLESIEGIVHGFRGLTRGSERE
jgi:hypothetical protein